MQQQTHIWRDAPLARTTDPLSSHDAGRRVAIHAGTQADRILSCLQREGIVMTAEQIAERTGIPVYTVRKRLPYPLEKHSYVKAINRDTLTPGDVLRWVAVRQG